MPTSSSPALSASHTRPPPPHPPFFGFSHMPTSSSPRLFWLLTHAYLLLTPPFSFPHMPTSSSLRTFVSVISSSGGNSQSLTSLVPSRHQLCPNTISSVRPSLASVSLDHTTLFYLGTCLWSVSLLSVNSYEGVGTCAVPCWFLSS